MKLLSTGDPSTLGSYHKLCALLLGQESAATKYFADKISRQGEHEVVLADETQMMVLIASLVAKDPK